ncbi:hypothetical protein JCM21900_005485 [Sporobolomyces salmonicolor]
MPYFRLPREDATIFHEHVPDLHDPAKPTVVNHLGLGGIHLISNATVGAPIAFAFALLFPRQTLSLSVCGMAPLYSLMENLAAYHKLHAIWLQDYDPEAFFDAVDELCHYAFSDFLSTDTVDWSSSWWCRRYSPSHATRIFEPTGLRPDLLRQIHCPVLIVAGDNDVSCAPHISTAVLADLSASKHAELRIIEGTPRFHSPFRTASNP